MFSSQTDKWSTPIEFYKSVDREFNLKLDVCAEQGNAKCKEFFTEKQDALKQEWNKDFWMNPPYGRKIGKWIAKAVEQAEKHKVKAVLLLPSRTDTRWFHDYLYNKKNVQLRFLKGRLKFGSSKNAAPFPSLLAIIN